MKCLVTGAAGFIGSHLSEKLVAEGHTVIGFDDLSTGQMKNLEGIAKHPNFTHLHGSVTTGEIEMGNEDEYDPSLLEEVDWVFNLAAKADIVPSIEDPKTYHETNVTGTMTMLEAARKMKAKKFIYAASSSCYGIPDVYPTPETADLKPMYPYALTKYVGEQYVLHWAKVYKIPCVSLRLFNVYGPRSRTAGTYGAVFGVFLSQAANGKPLTVVGDGTQTRDFTYVSDVVDAFIRAAESDVKGCTMNVGSGSTNTVLDLALRLAGTNPIEHLPKRPGEPDCTFADISRIYVLLKWEPRVSFVEGVNKMKQLVDDFKSAPLWTRDTIAVATKAWFECLGAE